MKKSLSEVKKEKFFSKWDLIIYSLIVVLEIGLFCFVGTANSDKTVLNKIEVYYQENVIYEYDFLKNNGIINEIKYCTVSEKRIGDYTEVKITVPEGENTLIVSDGKAYMSEADCSAYPECVHNFQPINKGGEIIVCLPHKLKVVSFGSQDNEVVL